MSPRSLRFLLFLIAAFLVVFGTYVMWVNDSLLGKSIGVLFAGMGMITNLMQIFLKLPLEFSPRNAERDSDLLLPSAYSRKNRQKRIEIILPVSYYYSLKKQQRAQRADFIVSICIVAWQLFAIVILIAGSWGAWMTYTHRPIFPCTVLTKRVSSSNDGVYAPYLQVKVKMDEHSSIIVDALADGEPYYSQQAAQGKLNLFLLSSTYACHEPIPTCSSYGCSAPPGSWDISDKALSFPFNKSSD